MFEPLSSSSYVINSITSDLLEIRLPMEADMPLNKENEMETEPLLHSYAILFFGYSVSVILNVVINHHQYHVILLARISPLSLALSPSICLYHSSLPVGLLNHILCPYRAVLYFIG